MVEIMLNSKGPIPKIKINFSEIPEYQVRALAKAALELTEKVFSIPGEEERYQAWLVEYRKEQAAKKCRT